MWIRCRDKDTGHEYDLDSRDARIRMEIVEVIEDYPLNEGRFPRPAKHRVSKAGNSIGRTSRRKQTKSEE